jgi:hypothetical protein
VSPLERLSSSLIHGRLTPVSRAISCFEMPARIASGTRFAICSSSHASAARAARRRSPCSLRRPAGRRGSLYLGGAISRGGSECSSGSSVQWSWLTRLTAGRDGRHIVGRRLLQPTGGITITDAAHASRLSRWPSPRRRSPGTAVPLNVRTRSTPGVASRWWSDARAAACASMRKRPIVERGPIGSSCTADVVPMQRMQRAGPSAASVVRPRRASQACGTGCLFAYGSSSAGRCPRLSFSDVRLRASGSPSAISRQVLEVVGVP